MIGLLCVDIEDHRIPDTHSLRNIDWYECTYKIRHENKASVIKSIFLN